MLFVRLLLLYPLLIDGVKRGRLTVYVANSECSGYPSSSLLLALMMVLLVVALRCRLYVLALACSTRTRSTPVLPPLLRLVQPASPCARLFQTISVAKPSLSSACSVWMG